MKLKRNIAQFLSIGLLLNNIYFNANASELEIPNRYETIEGEAIIIDDSTVGELHEIEIFGNTVQDENNLEDIQSVGDLYVDKNGKPILDSQGREQYKFDIISTNSVVKIYEKGIKYTNFNTNLVTENDDSLIIQHSNLGELETTDSFTVNPNEKISVKIKSVGNHYNPSYALTMSIDDNRVASVSEHIIRDELLNNDFYVFEYINSSNNSTSGKIKLNNYFGIYEITDIFISTLEINDISEYKENKTTILLPCQLQKVGDTADRLYWDNEKGRYVIEKNIHSFITNSDSDVLANWGNIMNTIGIDNTGKEFLVTYSDAYNRNFDSISISGCKNTGWAVDESTLDPDTVYIKTYNNNGAKTLRTSRASNSIINDNMLNDYFRNKLCLFRTTPELIETNITSKLKTLTYEGKTHISVNTENGINPTLKVSVDRLPKVAKNAVEEAENNPVSDNISLARSYVNMLPESLYKDQLQEQLSNIFSSDITLEKQTATLNLDIYIKSENMLSLSLDTNSVSFEDYSGTEPVEKLNAVNITISSSLPYDLNAYMPVEITNADGSNTMDLDILNIRESSEAAYKQFENTTDKIVLKENCAKGSDINHSVDLKLDSNNAHIADVYKTVIKFEAQQK